MKAVFILIILTFSTFGYGYEFEQDYSLSGLIDPLFELYYGGPAAMALDPNDGNQVWVLYENCSRTVLGSGSAILVSYLIDPYLGKRFDFPINEAPSQLFGSAVSSMSIPDIVANDSYALTGLTFNAANNFVLEGARPDREPNTRHPVTGAVWVLNEIGEFILGPMRIIEPITQFVSGIAYDPTLDSYWTTDIASASLYDMVLTCCQEQQPPFISPNNRWLQEFQLRKGVGLQYGLLGTTNIFARSLTERSYMPTAPAPIYSTIAVPGFASPQDVSVDPVTGNIWVINNFPTSSVLELTPELVVVNHYNLESVTGGLRDATAVAVSDLYIIVGFTNEHYIAVFDKPAPGSSKKILF